MQAPDPNNPGPPGFMHTSTTQPGIVPHRPGPPAQGASFPSAHFTPRPMFHPNDPLQRQQAPIPMSVTASMPMNLSASSSANPTPFSQPPQAHAIMTQKPTMSAGLGHMHPQAMLSGAVNPVPSVTSLSSQTQQAMHMQGAANIAASVIHPHQQGGSSVAASVTAVPHAAASVVTSVSSGGPQGPASGAGIMPPAAHHTGLPSFNQPASNFMPAGGMVPQIAIPTGPVVAPVPPLQQISTPHNRPIQAVQPHQQVPVVQTMPPTGASNVPHAGPGGQQAQQFQRLKVEDALSYLDQVKLQFGNHPQVYNDFLDIMKEFKSQSIDTPGVISRVSTLFKGHPELIVGFNTFLPPGYKIEVQANDTISVQQPGQPSMSLSQLAGATNRDNHPPHQQSTSKFKPVNLSVNVPSSSSHHSEKPRTGLDNVVAAATAGTISTTPGQPVEFNHAINYVNKIKNRFQGSPEIYKNFLEILHKYQKEQKQIKDSGKPLTETEVYSQVAKLFQNQEDLLKEFGQFLPDANGQGGLFGKSGLFGEPRDHTSNTTSSSSMKKPFSVTSGKSSSAKLSSSSSSLRKLSGFGSGGVPPSKKSKMSAVSSSGMSHKDVTLAEAGKYGSLSEYAFFDKVRKVLRSQEVYENFLRCLVLFNQEVISRTELIQLAQPFLGKFPELFRRFKDLLGYKDSGAIIEAVASNTLNTQPKAERMMRDDLAMEIDYSSCKRYGHSYRGLPKSYHPPRCTGRTTLCREVLNDTWVSFPSWSEESTFVTSRKTQFEESIYRCEDERFELDMVIELNLATIRVLEGVQKKLARMSSEDAAKFKLDNSLGGSSEVLHRKAIHRIYGDKAGDIIDGIKKNPVVAVPLVLRRLKSKDDEWKEAQRQFNKIWKEQNEKYYLKSLDHQGINFKQNDVKSLRSKSLVNEIEAIYSAEQEGKKESQNGTADDQAVISPTSDEAERKPHLIFSYKSVQTVDDAMCLIIHHARRQSSIQKEDKQYIKQLMRQNVQKFFHRPALPLSDDEDDDDESDEDEGKGFKSQSPNSMTYGQDKPPRRSSSRVKISSSSASLNKDDKKSGAGGGKDDKEYNGGTGGDDMCENENTEADAYSLFYADSHWYLFLRLQQILCHRLNQIKVVCDRLVAENDKCKEDKRDSVAVALRLKMPNEIEPNQYYSTFLELIKQLLDGNIESNNYEDQLREIFGIHAFTTFTMDKVIQNIVKQLQCIVTEESCRDVTDAWIRESANSATGGSLSDRQTRFTAENTYRKRMENMLHEDNCFEVTMYKTGYSLAFTLLDTNDDGSVVSGLALAERWTDYTDKFVLGGLDPDTSEDVKQHLKRKPIFLKRNLASWQKHNDAAKEKAQAAALAVKSAISIESDVTAASTTDTAKQAAEETSSPEKTEEKDKPSDDTDPAETGTTEPVTPAVLTPAESSSEEQQQNTESEKQAEDKSSSDKPADDTESSDVKTEPTMEEVKMETDETQSAAEELLKLPDSTVRQQVEDEDSNDNIKGELPPGLALLEGEECKFNPDSYKKVTVVQSENYLYRNGSLTMAAKTHKKVSKKMYKGWDKYCKDWRDDNTSNSECNKIKVWLNGDHLEDAKPCQTVCRRDNDLELAPYRVYSRYSVRYEKVTAAVTSAIDDGSLTALTSASDEAMDIN